MRKKQKNKFHRKTKTNDMFTEIPSESVKENFDGYYDLKKLKGDSKKT